MNDFQVIFQKFERNRQKKRSSSEKKKRTKKASAFVAGCSLDAARSAALYKWLSKAQSDKILPSLPVPYGQGTAYAVSVKTCARFKVCTNGSLTQQAASTSFEFPGKKEGPNSADAEPLETWTWFELCTNRSHIALSSIKSVKSLSLTVYGQSRIVSKKIGQIDNRNASGGRIACCVCGSALLMLLKGNA